MPRSRPFCPVLVRPASSVGGAPALGAKVAPRGAKNPSALARLRSSSGESLLRSLPTLGVSGWAVAAAAAAPRAPPSVFQGAPCLRPRLFVLVGCFVVGGQMRPLRARTDMRPLRARTDGKTAASRPYGLKNGRFAPVLYADNRLTVNEMKRNTNKMLIWVLHVGKILYLCSVSVYHCK